MILDFFKAIVHLHIYFRSKRSREPTKPIRGGVGKSGNTPDVTVIRELRPVHTAVSVARAESRCPEQIQQRRLLILGNVKSL